MSLNSLQTQPMTYWAPGAPDGFGSRSWTAPVTIYCRWQDQSDREIDDTGVEFVSRAVIYPTQTLELHGMVYKGISSATDPMTLDDAYTIRSVRQSENPSGSIVVHKILVGGAL